MNHQPRTLKSNGICFFIHCVAFLALAVACRHAAAEESAAPLANIAHLILSYACQHDASDVHLDPVSLDGAEVGRIRLRLDGSLHEFCRFDRSLLPAVVRELKAAAGLDVNETRFPQEGRLELRLADRRAEVRVRKPRVPGGLRLGHSRRRADEGGPGGCLTFFVRAKA